MDQGSAVPIGSFIEPVDLLTVLSDVMGLIQRELRLQQKIRAQMPSAQIDKTIILTAQWVDYPEKPSLNTRMAAMEERASEMIACKRRCEIFHRGIPKYW